MYVCVKRRSSLHTLRLSRWAVLSIISRGFRCTCMYIGPSSSICQQLLFFFLYLRRCFFLRPLFQTLNTVYIPFFLALSSGCAFLSFFFSGYGWLYTYFYLPLLLLLPFHFLLPFFFLFFFFSRAQIRDGSTRRKTTQKKKLFFLFFSYPPRFVTVSIHFIFFFFLVVVSNVFQLIRQEKELSRVFFFFFVFFSHFKKMLFFYFWWCALKFLLTHRVLF